MDWNRPRRFATARGRRPRRSERPAGRWRALPSRRCLRESRSRRRGRTGRNADAGGERQRSHRPVLARGVELHGMQRKPSRAGVEVSRREDEFTGLSAAARTIGMHDLSHGRGPCGQEDVPVDDECRVQSHPEEIAGLPSPGTYRLAQFELDKRSGRSAATRGRTDDSGVRLDGLHRLGLNIRQGKGRQEGGEQVLEFHRFPNRLCGADYRLTLPLPIFASRQPVIGWPRPLMMRRSIRRSRP